MLCQLLDGYSSVLEHSLIAIDIAYFRGVANCVEIAWIVNSNGLISVVFELADIFGINEVAIFAFLDRNSSSLASSLIG